MLFFVFAGQQPLTSRSDSRLRCSGQRKDGQRDDLDRVLSFSGANITMSQQADQLRCPLFHASLVA